MHTTKLRKVGGSVMLVVPPAMLDMLHLRAGVTVQLAVEGDCLVVRCRNRPRYSLDELLAQCDQTVSPTKKDLQWLEAHSIGQEL